MKLPPLSGAGRGVVLARLIVNGVLQALAAVATLALTRAIFDRLVRVETGRGFVPLGGGLLIVVLAAAWLIMRERFDAERLGQSYARQLRIAMFEQLTRATPRALQRYSRGAVILRFVGDLTALREWLSLGLAKLAVAGIVVTVTVTALASMSLPLAFVVTGILLCGTLISIGVGRPLAAALADARRRRARVAANVSEKVASMPVVQVHGQERHERKKLDRQSRRLERAMVRRARWVGMLRAVGHATGRLASGAVLIVSAFEVQHGAVTPGTVVAAVAVVGLLSPSIRGLGRVFEFWSKARVARAKLEAFLETPYLMRTRGGTHRLEDGPGDLRFDKVSFGVLKNLEAHAEAGTRIAIVGPNGAGKSTLIWLAAGLMKPEQGRVLLDGRDLARDRAHERARRGSLRRGIGIVGSGLPLLRGTVLANVSYRWSAAPTEAVEEACRLSGLQAILQDLPRGLDTRLLDQGANLSEGQRQRTALARALLGRPRLLLLDEIEANLDPLSRSAVDATLRSYPGTILFVTHELQWLRGADVVWYVADGELVQVGSPRELLSRPGPTAELFANWRAVS